MTGLSFSLFLSSAAQAAAAAKASFTDLQHVKWAEKQITQMNLLEVIEGRGDSTFAPQDNVTNQETVIMMIRLMGLDSQLSAGVSGYPADEWAQSYIKLAIDLGLLDQDDLGPGWGRASASRETVTELVVRGIQSANQISGLTADSSPFTDIGNASANLVNAIHVATELKIVNGFPDNEFKPLQNVTRAQMAKILNASLPYLALDETSPCSPKGKIWRN